MKLSIVGSGNMGYHLCQRFYESGLGISTVFSRSREKATNITEAFGGVPVTSLADLDTEVDLVIIAVRDEAISDVAKKISNDAHAGFCIAHTAGCVPSDVLSGFENFGVLYPLQTLTIGRNVNWNTLPLLISGNNRHSFSVIEKAATHLSPVIKEVDDKERIVLHLGATIANNFSNHMFAIAEKVVNQHGLSFDLLKPLILETSLKVQELSPINAQTGAAARGDQTTMDKHIKLLNNNPEIAGLYKEISESIERFVSGRD